MPNGNSPFEFQKEEEQIMEVHDSTSSPLIKSENSNKQGEDSPPSDGQYPTRFTVSGEHGSILSEFYGFIGTMTAVVGVGIFMIRAYVPDYWLEFVGIHYYPNRYWELGVPSYVAVMIVVAIVLYTGLNFLATPPPTSLKSVFDEYSDDLLSLSGIPLTGDGEPAIEPVSDPNYEMIDNLKSEPSYRLSSSHEFSHAGEIQYCD